MTTTPLSAALAPVPQYDFPLWLPAMLVKELRQGLRARGFVGLFISFQLVMIGMFVWAVLLSDSHASESVRSLNTFFWVLLGALLVFITPLRGMNALRDEIEAKTIDLLVLTRLNSWKIVLGKWSSLVAQAFLLVVSLLPYVVVRYFFGAINLVEDFSKIVTMLGASAVLTGVALWISGMPKIIRTLLPVFIVLGFQGSMYSMIARASFAHSTSVGASSVSGLSSNVTLNVFDGALLLVFFLHQAVRRLAPPAENHALVTRLIALVPLAPVPFLHFLHLYSDEKWQADLAFIFLLIVAATEIASSAVPLGVQWRKWADRGNGGSWSGSLLLPGWPSAVLFAGAALALHLLCGLGRTGSEFRHGWIFVLAWEALVFPAVLISFLPARSTLRLGGKGYFVLQALFGIGSLISASNVADSLLGPFARWANSICRFLPVSSFWKRLAEESKPVPSSGQDVIQLLVLITVVVLFYYASTSYWARLKTFRRPQLVAAVPPGSQAA